ncbi:hypothetical protein Rahaq2_1709 [Rahnella aquatilis CIP 78.65 = ATCC 33071]|uniref:Uncharacterized protein n=1 Tax=Rahnella aquatilis (strain ATCC 33071 / DSM 4594 / JCM 1683 / NBRC 105701 / NCIMB 13365 / CIP 78.65) TaxID=745277 RepID=H2IT63_RAHAC|nr:hypothetical protein Rahaq2_1709 [Rahnella aquatilis CIP 78.65 = ATCC 33071]
MVADFQYFSLLKYIENDKIVTHVMIKNTS